jgi:hypothetical protein
MPRRRRTTACDLCRSRKIRCDAVSVGIPCSDCLRHASNCVVSEALSTPPQLKQAIPLARTHKFRLKAQVDGVVEGRSNTTRLSFGPPSRSIAQGEDREQFTVNSEAGSIGPRHLHLPPFITPLCTTVDADDVQILVQRNALSFPPTDIINDMIRSFICYVYPTMPMLRLDDFLAAIAGEPGKTISPLLFQAVLLAGAVFTDFSRRQHPTFKQSKDVQKLLFGRAKLLFDMDVETNPLIIIQSLLLMTYWHSQLNDTKGRFYWLRIALSLATEIGLHNSDLKYGEPEEDHFRRRLWSCCIIRSQLLSIGERRHVVLPHAAARQPHLTFEHWNGSSLSKALDAYSVTHTTQEMDMVGCVCVHEAELCEIIEQILDTLYEPNGLRKTASRHSIMLLIPTTKDTGPLVMTLDEKLREWHRKASHLGLFNRQLGDYDSVVPIHSATLEMLYLTALSVVHRPFMLQQRQQGPATEVMREFSATTLRSSACRITEIGRELEVRNQISHLPPVSTALFLTASIQHLKDAMSPNLDNCQSGSLYLGQTLRIFRLLVDRYNHVNSAIEFISRVQDGQQFDHSIEWEDRVHPQKDSHSEQDGHPRSAMRAAAITSSLDHTSQLIAGGLDGEHGEDSARSTDRLDGRWDLQMAIPPFLDEISDMFLAAGVYSH